MPSTVAPPRLVLKSAESVVMLARVYPEDTNMPIIVKLDDLLHDRRMTQADLAGRVGLTFANLSILKTGKARALRVSTLEAICQALGSEPGDLLRFEAEPHKG